MSIKRFSVLSINGLKNSRQIFLKLYEKENLLSDKKIKKHL